MSTPSEQQASSHNDPYETSGIQDGFQLPRWIWHALFGCYAVFMIGVTLATGHDTGTIMVILISLFYMAMFFGSVGVLNGLKGRERPSPLDRAGGVLETWTGPMDSHAVAGQILAVPLGFAFLGIAFYFICAFAGLE